jgi:hypothetical protein
MHGDPKKFKQGARHLQSEKATMCTPGSKISKYSNTQRVNELIILNKKYMINNRIKIVK